VPSDRVSAFLQEVRRRYFLPLLQPTSLLQNTSESSVSYKSSLASQGTEGKSTEGEAGETYLFVTTPSRGASYIEVTQDWDV
jgi:hypothetical protein